MSLVPQGSLLGRHSNDIVYSLIMFVKMYIYIIIYNIILVARYQKTMMIEVSSYYVSIL